MIIHLIKDASVSNDLVAEVTDLLQSYTGPMLFKHFKHSIQLDNIPYSIKKYYEDDFVFVAKHLAMEEDQLVSDTSFPITRKIYHPEKILEKCYSFRQRKKLHEKEIVVFLTEASNSFNWFSFFQARDICINTSDWNYYLSSEIRFPISYQIVANILQLLLFNNMQQLSQHAHQDKSIGCINDFCHDKREVKLKMRTGDICESCLELIEERKIPAGILKQVIEVITDVKQKMLAIDRFRTSRKMSRLKIDKELNVVLVDAEEYKVKLTPLEKTVFHLYLNHPEGIRSSAIALYKEELSRLYAKYTRSSNFSYQQNNIDRLTNPNDNSLQEKMSKIRRKFKNALGKKQYMQYAIYRDSKDKKHKIRLDRSLVIIEH
jgi:hypothetical protein